MIRIRPNNSELSDDEIDIRMSRLDLIRLIRECGESAIFNEDLMIKARGGLVDLFSESRFLAKTDSEIFQAMFEDCMKVGF